ncbi:AarF/UbiB family protein [Agromyces salentinus]|uniref:AarF/UbiB family protein n=2 Tax=Agromyces salentinus TaxID=269421 RepID=A0ABP4YRQ1_9MICO
MLAALAVGLAAILYILVVGLLARRVLETPIGWPRAIIVGLVVFVASVSLLRAVELGSGLLAPAGSLAVDRVIFVLFITVAAGWTVACGIGILVALELVWPTRHFGGPVAAVKAFRARRRRARRYAQVLAIASRHGLGPLVHGGKVSDAAAWLPGALVDALNEAGVTFVKFGQVLSTRDDLVPPEYTRALATLQAGSSTVAWDRIRTVIEQELGGPIDATFASIDEQPLAAASVAQVHTATLLDGTEVVVKVQRPDAAAQVRADVDIILRLAARIEERTDWGSEYGVVDLADGFAAALNEELDYRIEAANMTALGRIADESESAAIRIPRAFEAVSTARMLVMDRVDGEPIGASADRLSQLDPELRTELAKGVLDAVLEQALVRGMFHADLHPGNLLLTADGDIALIDCGSVGVLERSLRERIAALLLAVINDDDIGTTDVVLLVAEAADDTDRVALQRDIGRVLTRMQVSTQTGRIFMQLLDVLRDHRLAVPPAMTLAFRTIVSLEGSLRRIDPDFDLVETGLARVPHFMRRMLAWRRVLGAAEATAAVAAVQARTMPRRIDAITSSLERGTLGVRVRAFEGTDERSWIGSIVAQLTTTLIAIAGIVTAAILVVSDAGPFLTANVRTTAFVGVVIGLAAFLLLFRSLRVAFVRRRR